MLLLLIAFMLQSYFVINPAGCTECNQFYLKERVENKFSQALFQIKRFAGEACSRDSSYYHYRT